MRGGSEIAGRALPYPFLGAGNLRALWREATDHCAPWSIEKPTALLVLADGTVIEGRGLGAVGSAVAEVCFNTALTGYQEILTDPSYAGQIVTFTFPHIGNIGTNDEDQEDLTPAARHGAVGAVFKADVTSPSNYRAGSDLDQWLKRRGVIAMSGIDTRALTALIREKGMPNAVIAHAPDGVFDLADLKAAPRHGPGSSTSTSPRKSPPASRRSGARRPGSGTRAMASRTIRRCMSSPSTTA